MSGKQWLLASLALVAGPAIDGAAGGDWLRFRGPAGSGIAESSSRPTPLRWSRTENVKWRIGLANPGNSSPIVSGDRIFLTDANRDGTVRSLHCYEQATGKELWNRSVPAPANEPTHSTNPYGSTSPAADGQRVVVWQGSGGLQCYDYHGKELWSVDLGTFVHIWGYAASPIFYRDRVLVHAGPGERTFLAAYDAATGRKLWQVDEPGGHSGLAAAPASRPQEKTAPRPEEKKGVEKKAQAPRAPWIGSWSTPVVATLDGQDQVLVSFPQHVKAFDPLSGQLHWQCDGLSNLVYTSIVLGDGVGVAMGGFHGPAIGFRLGGQGNVTESNRLWRISERNPQRIGSGIILGRQMFMANEGGTVQCLDVDSGKNRWEDRLPGGSLWGSLVLSDGRLMVTNQRGETIVVAPNPDRFELLAVNALGEKSNSTPAIADGQIFLRTFAALYCIEESSSPAP